MTTSSSWASEWLHSDTVRALALTLGHFVWEGLALAALLFCATRLCQRAQTRYLLAVCTLAAMLIAPVWTFSVLSKTPPSLAVAATGSGPSDRSNPNQSAAAYDRTSSKPITSANWPAWCACIWFAGVLVFSTRALGGWIMLMRFRRKNTSAIPVHLLERCRTFEQRLGLRRRIHYLQSRIMDTPSVAGWLRPVVLIPVSALSGLSPEQLEAVIVHELAHVKRLDGLVNLFKIAVETLRF